MPRKIALVRALLIVLGVVPISIWIALASAHEPTGLGRIFVKAALVVSTQLPLGGALMLLGSALFAARPQVGRVLATSGAAIVACGSGSFFAIAWAADVRAPELTVELGVFAYALLHGALVALIWCAPRDSAVAA